MATIVDYQKIAYRVLGLRDMSEPETRIHLRLGTFRIIESDAALDAVVEAYLKNLRLKVRQVVDNFHEKKEELLEVGENILSDRYSKLEDRHLNNLKIAYRRSFLSWEDFNKFHGREDSEYDKEWGNYRHDVATKHGAELVRMNARFGFASAQRKNTVSKTRRGYREYLYNTNRDLCLALEEDLQASVPEQPRISHSYIVSTTETGKSELLKAIVRSYLRYPKYCSLMLLDPGGDMVDQIARWPEVQRQDRLVYIHPNLSEKHTPIINPFDPLENSLAARTVQAGQVMAVLGSLIEGELGGTLSNNMKAILRNSLRFMIDTPNTTLHDLQDLMLGDKRLLNLAQNSPREDVSKFFSEVFNKVETLSSSKQSIAVKIQGLIDTLGPLVCGPSTVKLKTLLAQKKVVLFNLATGHLDPDTTKTFGAFLVSLVQSIGLRRALLDRNKRPRTHLIIDECQNFITPEVMKIIEETRKFGLSLTMAQQSVGRGMSKEIKDVVTTTTNVMVAGRSTIKGTRESGDLVQVSADDISQLKVGQFYYRVSGVHPAFLLRTRSDLIDEKGGVDTKQWTKIQKAQVEKYYADRSELTLGVTLPEATTTKKKHDLTDGKNPPKDKIRFELE